LTTARQYAKLQSNNKKEVKDVKIALIAHDKKKDDIIKLAIKYKDVLKEHRLFATGTTGSLIMAETGLDIIRMKSGPLGGDQQIGSMIADGELDLVIFLRDPLTSQPHEPDVSALMRLCDVRNIPLATNKTSAAIMLKALSDGDIAEAEKDN
jgi:methylglyoxal synthase